MKKHRSLQKKQLGLVVSAISALLAGAVDTAFAAEEELEEISFQYSPISPSGFVCRPSASSFSARGTWKKAHCQSRFAHRPVSLEKPANWEHPETRGRAVP